MGENLKGSTVALLLSLIAVVELFSYGAGLLHHYIYNVEPLLSLGIAEDDFLGPGNPLTFTYHFIRHVTPLLDSDWRYLFLAFAQRLVLLWLLYRVALELLGRRGAALAVTLLFALSYNYYAHGLVHLGLWSKLKFMPITLAATLLFAGMWAQLRGRAAWGYGLFLAAMQVHPLNSVAALAFIVPGLWWHAAASGRGVRTHLAGTLLLGAGVGYLAWATMGHPLPGLAASTGEWYRYAYFLDPDDVSALWSLGFGGFLYLPMLFGALYLSWREREGRGRLDHLLWGATLALVMVLLLELMHRGGIFLGRFSELFIGVEVRRGLWVAALLSLARIARWAADRRTVAGGVEGAIGAAAVAVYLLPSSLATVLVCGASARLRRSAPLWGLTAVAAGFGVVQYLYYADRGYTRTVLSSLIIAAVAAALYAAVAARGRTDRRIAVVAVPLLLVLGAGLAYGVYQGRIAQSLVAGGGDSGERYFEELALQVRKGAGHLSLAACMRALPPGGGKVAIPPARGFRDFDFAREVYIDGTDLDYSLFTKRQYEYFKAKIRALYGERGLARFVRLVEGREVADKAQWMERVDAIHRDVVPAEIADRLARLGIGYWMTDRPLADSSPVCADGKLFVYRVP
ncbi:hypothetical protein [Endothiovibrio diazotrophicus]